MRFSGRRSVIQYGLMVVLVLPVLLAAVKTFELLFYYDSATGMLGGGGGAAVFRWILGIGTAVTVAAGIWVSVEINRAAGSYRLGRPLVLGIGLFVAGVFFLGQSVSDLLVVLSDHRLKIGGLQADISYLQVAVSAFGLVTGVVIIGLAYMLIATGRRPNALFSMVPAVWCVLFMLNLLYSYENLVSMQDNAVKTVCGVLALLFLYYFGRSFSGLDDGIEAGPGVFARVLFPGIGFLTTAPYCIAWLCGVRDRAGNMPYLALAGLSVLAAISLMQLCVGAILGLRRMEKRQLGQAGAPPQPPVKG